MKTVFLGGTCAGSQWRAQLQALLTPTVHAFDPVVPDWNEAAQAVEDQHREQDDYVLYALTPLMEGGYSLVEATDDSNKRPAKTLVVVLETDGDARFTEHQLKGLKKSVKLWAANGARAFASLAEVATFLNATP